MRLAGKTMGKRSPKRAPTVHMDAGRPEQKTMRPVYCECTKIPDHEFDSRLTKDWGKVNCFLCLDRRSKEPNPPMSVGVNLALHQTRKRAEKEQHDA